MTRLCRNTEHPDTCDAQQTRWCWPTDLLLKLQAIAMLGGPR